ncbi:MAG: hypothetical protein KGZ69_08765 [Methylomonas sp.]|nr:hypothetical protein [Methylomonas sp.]
MSDNKIVSLHGDAIVTGQEPIEGCVKLMAHHFEKVGSGEIVAFAIVTVGANHNVGTQWYDPGDYKHDIASGVMMLQHRIAREIVDSGEEGDEGLDDGA